MGKLGYWQECYILRVSEVKKTADHGKIAECLYLELDISARNANTGAALNKRYLVVRVLNKKLQKFVKLLRLPSLVKVRLYASGFRLKEAANRCGAPLDVYEIIGFDEDENQL